MKPLLLVVIGGVVGGLVSLVLIALPYLPTAASEQAGRWDSLWFAVLGGAGVIFGIVTVLLVYSIFAFRAKHGQLEDGDPLHGLTWLEVVWTAIPAVIVFVLAGVSYFVLDNNEKGFANPSALEVDVHAFTYNWDYTYPKEGIKASSELVLPVGRPVKFKIHTTDVIHSFWVPEWRLQMNATPGQVNTLTVTPTKTGSFTLVCAFLCGPGHGYMNSAVEGNTGINPIKVVTQAEYDAWVADQAKAAQEQAASPEGQAVAAFNAAGCGGCHAWTPAGSKGNVGPALDDVSGDAKTAGKPLADFVRESIENPGAYVAKGYPNAMPPTAGKSLTPDQLDALVKAIAGGGSQ